MIASVHLADVSIGTALSVVRRAPKPAEVPGLRSARVGTAAPLRSTNKLPRPSVHRVALIAMWDGADALDAFEAEHKTGHALANGVAMRLEPLRIHGSWPGIDADLPAARRVNYDGPSVVL